MPFRLELPVSETHRLALLEQTAGKGEPRYETVEHFKNRKILETARQTGIVPPMKDEDGKNINPHLPEYVCQPPWYYNSITPTLRHQRYRGKVYDQLDADFNFKKGIFFKSIATKYRKGACENCGAMTHKKKDCLERPRKIGARFSGDSIAPDEIMPVNLKLDFESKRDPWVGFDTKEHHRKLLQEYRKLEVTKQALKDAMLESEQKNGDTTKSGVAADDEDKYTENMDMPGQKFKVKNRMTIRDLRIREDTAKYLFNLDVNSAYYVPKTHSMKQDPLANTGKESSLSLFAGDNFLRSSGHAHEFAKQQVFAWAASKQGTELHLNADPTKLELMSREFQNRWHQFKRSTKDSALDRYGGQEHLDAPPKQLLLAQTENYVEYSRHGLVIKGRGKAQVRSCYEEDIYRNNHTSVWGSYWKDGRWGYSCCHSYIKESYCTGEAGIQAQEESSLALSMPTVSLSDKKSSSSSKEKKSKKKKKNSNKRRRKQSKRKKTSSSSSSDSSSSDSSSSNSSSSDSSSSSESDSESESDKEKRRRKKLKRLVES